MDTKELFWYSVDDILPEDDAGYVLVKLASIHGHPGTHRGSDRYTADGVWGRWKHAYDSGFKVTHWAHQCKTRLEVESAQRDRILAKFANRAKTPATADFDLPAPNDCIA